MTRLLGYSERGALGSLLTDIARSSDHCGTLTRFLELCNFPETEINSAVIDFQIYLEYSLSGFGSPDAVITLDGETKRCLFLEAKVATAQVSDWTITKEYNSFIQGIEQDEVSSSNLFSQIYHKVRFATSASDGSLAAAIEGVAFPSCSTQPIRKLGDNPVVNRFANDIASYLSDPFYLIVVPDKDSSLTAFFSNTLKQSPPAEYDGWDSTRFGFVSWFSIERFAVEEGLLDFLATAKHNREQIYGRNCV